MSKNLFITGTGTDVGKTYVTGLIIKKLAQFQKNPAYYKAAMSGNYRRMDGTLIPGDAVWVKTVSEIAQPLAEMCPYIYEHAYSPHLSSRFEGNPVQMEVVKKGFEFLSSRYDSVTMEGSGGILCPICYDEAKIQLEDVITELGLSCLVVADAGLGTINHVGLTVFYLRQKKIPVKGIIFNHYHPGDVIGHAATIANHRVFEGFLSDNPEHALMHGPTFMGNALACSVALKSIELFEQGNYMARIARIEEITRLEMAGFSDPRIKEIRIMGGCVCIEVHDPKTLQGFQSFAYERGVFSRPFLKYMYAMVPYVIEEPQLVQILDTMKAWFRR